KIKGKIEIIIKILKTNMHNLEDLNRLYNKPAVEVKKVLKEAEKYTKPKDRKVVVALGMRYPEKIYIIRITLEAFDLLNGGKKEGELQKTKEKIEIQKNN